MRLRESGAKMIKYTLAIKLPSLNDFLSKTKKSHFLGNAMKQSIQNDICWQIKQQGIKKAKKKVDIYINWFEANKRRDKDNVISSTKFLADSLVNLGIIKDDGWQYVGQYYPKVYLAKDKKYRVEIELKESEEIENEQR